MAKIKWTFNDEQGTNLNRYTATNVSNGEKTIFDLLRNANITNVGTPLNAENLNALINSINACYDEVAGIKFVETSNTTNSLTSSDIMEIQSDSPAGLELEPGIYLINRTIILIINNDGYGYGYGSLISFRDGYIDLWSAKYDIDASQLNLDCASINLSNGAVEGPTSVFIQTVQKITSIR